MKIKTFQSVHALYIEEVIGRKIRILHDNGKITNKVKAGLARPILIEHECKNESNCNLCINYLRYLEVWRSKS